MVLPGTGKSFDQFRADDGECRRFAATESGTTPGEAALDSGARSAALGTALGGIAGAAIGGSRGAAAGAGAGLLAGGLAGTATGGQSAWSVQTRYDHAFEQCMYAKGHRIPASGPFASQLPKHEYVPAPPPPPPPTRRN
jgi:hypothetical protein